ncbi:endonuclease [Pseudidiomarina woesei]|uniref:Endonuclease I n=1 Tax=Pseudidiomarina woesei TaxID=1381080 RepID=A0A0K6GWT9_9GAMM|nr:endonuclease [Pseudidiomarina woesei]CUA83202.1 Endonuclease I [Pseudidiomarina woesei]
MSAHTNKSLFKKGLIAVSSFSLLSLSFTVFAAPPAGYYNNVDATNAQTLQQSLHEIIDDHQRFPYTSSSTDTWDILEAADQDPDNPNNVIDIYKNASYGKVGGGNTLYNREHSWPKSYGFPNDGSSNYAYTDAHHLFISDSSYNSSRSNKPYANCTSACTEKPTEFNNGRGGSSSQSNWTDGSFDTGSWETWSGRRGDVARALMYMAVRYEGGTHGVTGHSEPDLILTDDRNLIAQSNQGANISVAYMGLKSVLLQWHQEDPVDDMERRRNDVVYSYQGNRNPFIDNPEYVACVFENICNGGGGGSGDTTAPAAPSYLSATPGTGIVSLAWNQGSESDLAGYYVYRRDMSGSNYTRLNTALITTAAFDDYNVTGGSTYFYVVTAVDTSGNESVFSSEVNATPNQGSTDSGQVWINELHYDNDGTDTGEFVEVAGSAGTDLSGWQIIAYNGNGGGAYATGNLSGVITNQSNGFGAVSVAMSGLQNGSPDGVALIDAQGSVVQFLSYEGSFTATDGPASGMTSQDIGVSETTSTPVGQSLQLAGSGSQYSDFSWQAPQTSSPGTLNAGQSFVSAEPVNEAPVASFSTTCNNLDCSFDGAASTDTDGSVVSYSWDFGDGNAASGVSVNHSYAVAGDYAATLTVTDNATATDTMTVVLSVTAPPAAPVVWINELHYDNKGGDRNEFVEVAGTAGSDVSGWSIQGYNGADGGVYASISLSGVIANQQNGFGTLAFDFSGLQNGSPDGLALVDAQGQVVQFISYEGTFVASAGAAAGLTSEAIGVEETSNTSANDSLQLSGSGSQYSDFIWQNPARNTAGSVNNGQTLGL